MVTQSYSDYSDDEDDANPNGLPSAAEISKEVYGLATVIKLLREKTLTKGIIEYLVQVCLVTIVYEDLNGFIMSLQNVQLITNSPSH